MRLAENTRSRAERKAALPSLEDLDAALLAVLRRDGQWRLALRVGLGDLAATQCF